jgi:hypothetical protein
MENGNFRLFAANGKRKRQTSVRLLQMRTEKVDFLGGQTINSNRRLLFQQSCPSVVKRNRLHFCEAFYLFFCEGVVP